MIEIQNNAPTPIYEQVISGIKEMIQKGELKSGESLPSIRNLASTLDVAGNTIARAYNELERAGYVKSYAMKGTFVCDRIEEKPDALADLLIVLNQLNKRGYSKSQIHQFVEEYFEKPLKQL